MCARKTLFHRIIAGRREQQAQLVARENMAYAEVALALGTPIGTVMSRPSRGRARLRGLMDGRTELVRLKVVK